MIPRPLKYFACAVLISFSVNGQTLKNIEIQGARKFSVSQYIGMINIPRNSKIFDGIKDSAAIRIGRGLKENGYFNFNISNIGLNFDRDSSEFNLYLTVNEGFPSEIRSVKIDGVAKEDSIIVFSFYDYLSGQIYNRYAVESAINKSLDYFENNGYPFTRITIEGMNFEEDSTREVIYTDINISVDRGILSKIDALEISGNDKTSDDVVIRNIRLKKGEIYSQKRIDEIPKNLNRLRFFEPAAPPKFYLNSKKEGVLQILIKEKETNNFDGIIGYVPGNDKEKGYLTGKVNISLRNLFGTGRAAAFRWEQIERNSQELELKYLEPWLFGYPFNINLGLFQRKQDSTYVQRTYGGSVEFLATESISASFLINGESTIPTINDSSVFTVFNSSTISTGFNFKFDTRDDIFVPREGFLFLNTYKYNSKTIDGPPRFITPATKTKSIIQKFEFDFEFFHEFFMRQIAAVKIHAREMRGDDLETSDLYLLGGTNTLRGYRENQFQANRLVWTNFEYRYLLTRRSYAFLFFDGAYLLRNENKNRSIERTEGIKLGYGLGLSIETGIGILAVSYAIAEGSSFSDGLIHFGIINEF